MTPADAVSDGEPALTGETACDGRLVKTLPDRRCEPFPTGAGEDGSLVEAVDELSRTA